MIKIPIKQLILKIKAQGPPGSGKTTAIAFAEFLFRQHGYAVIERKESSIILTYKKKKLNKR